MTAFTLRAYLDPSPHHDLTHVELCIDSKRQAIAECTFHLMMQRMGFKPSDYGVVHIVRSLDIELSAVNETRSRRPDPVTLHNSFNARINQIHRRMK